MTKQQAVVIDNGSWRMRAGLSTDRNPRIDMPNVVAKDADKKWLVGDLASQERGGRSPFDSQYPLLVQPDLLEHQLDCIFSQLGIKQLQSVVMTETICNLKSSRAMSSELLFELYGAQRVTYGVDALYSHHYNSESSPPQ